MRTVLKLAAVLALVMATTSAPTALRAEGPMPAGPSFQTLGPLAFGPGGVLFAADRQAATIFALELGAQATAGAPGTKDVADIGQKVAALLGTDAAEIAITDLVVHPETRNTYLSVMRGQGAGAQAALVRVDGNGALVPISFDALKFTSVALPNPANVSNSGRGGRTESITDLAFANGRLFVAGLSNEEFASKFWTVAYPFGATDRGTSVEIFHGNHGRLETRSPVYAFVPTSVDGEASLIAGYLCTPLVKFAVSDLRPGAKILGKTIAELGNRNRPIDMVLYRKDGREFMLMSNTSRGVMKLDTATFDGAAPITAPVPEGTAGVPYETIASLTGIEQLDLLDAGRTIVLARADGGALHLKAVALP